MPPSSRCLQAAILISLGFVISLFLTGPVYAAAVISEVHWAGSDLSTADEWVELAGITEPTNIGGWKLTTVNTSGTEVTMITFPEGTTINPGQFIVVSRYTGAQTRLLHSPAFTTADMTLPNSKLLLRLRDGAGNITDQADDGVGAPFAGENVTSPLKKASMERVDLNVSGSVASNWITSHKMVGWKDGEMVVYGTPGFSTEPLPEPKSSASSLTNSARSSSSLSSAFSSNAGTYARSESSASPKSHSRLATDTSAFILLRVLPNPKGKDDGREEIEIMNVTPREQTLEGWSIHGDGIRKAIFGDVILQPWQSRVFSSDEILFAFPNRGGEARLIEPGGAIISRVTWNDADEEKSFFGKAITSAPVQGSVINVLDGDTFDVQLSGTPGIGGLKKTERVRLIGIDAPELFSSDPREMSLGKKSAAFLRHLLNGRTVHLSFDEETHDIYGRVLAYAETSEGVSIQEILLAEGLAAVETRFPFKKLEEFTEAQEEAKEEGVGIWSLGMSEKFKVESEKYSLNSSAGAGQSSSIRSVIALIQSDKSSASSSQAQSSSKKAVKKVSKKKASAKKAATIKQEIFMTPMQGIQSVMPEMEELQKLIMNPDSIIQKTSQNPPQPFISLSLLASGAASAGGAAFWVFRKIRM